MVSSCGVAGRGSYGRQDRPKPRGAHSGQRQVGPIAGHHTAEGRPQLPRAGQGPLPRRHDGEAHLVRASETLEPCCVTCRDAAYDIHSGALFLICLPRSDEHVLLCINHSMDVASLCVGD